jgi:hypothetical protein
MRQYVIDELSPSDYKRVRGFLNEKLGHSGIDRLYWLPLPGEILSGLQKSHADCRPFFFAIHLESGRMICEFLIRTKSRVNCDCLGYATAPQVSWLIAFADHVLSELGIRA